MALKNQAQETAEKKRQETTPEKEGVSLKGTFFFVMSLGVFLILSWAIVYGIFISR